MAFIKESITSIQLNNQKNQTFDFLVAKIDSLNLTILKMIFPFVI